MVFKTEAEAAGYVADRMAVSKSPTISVQVTDVPSSLETFTKMILDVRPELAACVAKLSMRTASCGLWNEVTFTVGYTDVMPSTVAVVKQINSIAGMMLRDVKLHRRSTDVVLDSKLEKQAKAVISKRTSDPQFMNCYLFSIAINQKRFPGSKLLSLRVRYTYSCGYTEYRRRVSEMSQSIDEIIQLAKNKGIQDWKKAFAVVEYCVKHWRYGRPEPEGIEFTAYAALVKHTAVCMGISLAICAIFLKLGIPCRYITGTRNDEGHAWNMVFLNGGWFYIDVTDAIVRKNPYFHWGMTTLQDRTVTDPINVTLECNCPESFLRLHV